MIPIENYCYTSIRVIYASLCFIYLNFILWSCLICGRKRSNGDAVTGFKTAENASILRRVWWGFIHNLKVHFKWTPPLSPLIFTHTSSGGITLCHVSLPALQYMYMYWSRNSFSEQISMYLSLSSSNWMTLVTRWGCTPALTLSIPHLHLLKEKKMVPLLL